MTKPDWKQVKDLFAEAIDQPADSRSEFLRSKCNGDDLLFSEVNSLLAASSEPGNLIEDNALDLASKVCVEENDYAERRFGAYKILREIGSGGMGTVFLAERDDGEFSMQVALKIVRQSVADREVVARFKRERQILAGLNHPNIAVLHDGGVSEKGEPYLAMEYVDGETLIDYADSHHLTIAEKLRLFLKICSAVAYAHRNLVVHRDIKPSNILVTRDGEPKLLDFGLAKAFESDGSKTQTALRAFTPAYASPEQIQGGNITTASDIYSLGVVFYEVLAGSKPLQVENMSFENILQTINTSQPVAPSKLSDRNGGSMPHRLLKGDLDNIALTALRKEPERRYSSVEDLAGDIQRHLRGLPVLARPSTFKYRASKFIKRNKVGVFAASLIFLSLVGGIVVSLWQARRAAEQAEIAKQESQTAQAEREKAEQALISAEKSKKFLRDMLSYANPAWYSRSGGKRDVTILEALNDAETRVDTEFADFAEVRADLHFTLGEIYNMMRYRGASGTSSVFREKARQHLTECLRLRSEIYGEQNAKTAEAYYLYATTFKPDLDKEIFYYRKALGIFRNTAPEDGNVPYLILDLSADLFNKGELDQAESFAQEGLALSRRINGDTHPSAAFLLESLGRTAYKRGQLEKADTLFDQAIEIAEMQDKTVALNILTYLKGDNEAVGNKAKAAEIQLKIVRLN